MPKEEREHLLREVEDIRLTIEKLQPVMREQSAESGRAVLTKLRKVLARDMELLHTQG